MNDLLLSEDVINRARALSSTLLADALSGITTMDFQIKPVKNGMKMVGTAITVDVAPGDNLYLHHAIYSVEEGYVIVCDGKDHKANAYLGELMAHSADAIGLEGIVIDGLVRDKEELENLNLPIFAKGFISSGPFKNGPGQFNIPISCGNVEVKPGDLIIGDDDGVVVVPKDQIEMALDKAEKKLAYESDRIQSINDFKKGKVKELKKPSWFDEKIGQDNE
ncbi:RraA family protein [Lentibacillus salicampi]|uniref:Putative 4-hydroxy-4-methyl-2-oxoglutarate aldolase n=1 Tax=Lentibacillus salicampi TaxID=175306 RepID=A0A4Y9A731_9BACI|nr:RraA family protein [Lentibacillus salicampi]TFJ91225.1 RraA family protein [Lentibacillus salicampi]